MKKSLYIFNTFFFIRALGSSFSQPFEMHTKRICSKFGIKKISFLTRGPSIHENITNFQIIRISKMASIAQNSPTKELIDRVNYSVSQRDLRESFT